MDFTRQELEHTQDECYSVRSQAEETRRTCWKLVREVLDATASTSTSTTTTTTNETKIASARQAYRRDLEQARDLGTVVPAVQILISAATRMVANGIGTRVHVGCDQGEGIANSAAD